jgi:hypothetical protein
MRLAIAMSEGGPAAERAALKGCPFCGGRAAFEAHPRSPDIVRVTCAGDDCGVRPATEYLLEEYRADLVRAWNARPGD